MTSHLDLLRMGERMRSERRRIGLSQETFAERCDVTEEVQIRFENGLDSYLMRAADLGVDIVFVLSGRRAADAPIAQEAP